RTPVFNPPPSGLPAGRGRGAGPAAPALIPDAMALGCSAPAIDLQFDTFVMLLTSGAPALPGLGVSDGNHDGNSVAMRTIATALRRLAGPVLVCVVLGALALPGMLTV